MNDSDQIDITCVVCRRIYTYHPQIAIHSRKVIDSSKYLGNYSWTNFYKHMQQSHNDGNERSAAFLLQKVKPMNIAEVVVIEEK